MAAQCLLSRACECQERDLSLRWGEGNAAMVGVAGIYSRQSAALPKNLIATNVTPAHAGNVHGAEPLLIRRE